jgi:hypothetical protein
MSYLSTAAVVAAPEPIRLSMGMVLCIVIVTDRSEKLTCFRSSVPVPSYGANDPIIALAKLQETL